MAIKRSNKPLSARHIAALLQDLLEASAFVCHCDRHPWWPHDPGGSGTSTPELTWREKVFAMAQKWKPADEDLLAASRSCVEQPLADRDLWISTTLAVLFVATASCHSR
jgi:hypothetical protein